MRWVRRSAGVCQDSTAALTEFGLKLAQEQRSISLEDDKLFCQLLDRARNSLTSASQSGLESVMGHAIKDLGEALCHILDNHVAAEESDILCCTAFLNDASLIVPSALLRPKSITRATSLLMDIPAISDTKYSVLGWECHAINAVHSLCNLQPGSWDPVECTLDHETITVQVGIIASTTAIDTKILNADQSTFLSRLAACSEMMRAMLLASNAQQAHKLMEDMFVRKFAKSLEGNFMPGLSCVPEFLSEATDYTPVPIIMKITHDEAAAAFLVALASLQDAQDSALQVCRALVGKLHGDFDYLSAQSSGNYSSWSTVRVSSPFIAACSAAQKAFESLQVVVCDSNLAAQDCQFGGVWALCRVVGCGHCLGVCGCVTVWVWCGRVGATVWVCVVCVWVCGCVGHGVRARARWARARARQG